MGAPKRQLPPALAANRWRPGQSGNPSGHSGEYGEAMRLARQAAPRAILRLMELAALDRIDEQGNLIPLHQLPEPDHRVIAVMDSLLEGTRIRTLGPPWEKNANMRSRAKIGKSRPGPPRRGEA